MSAVKTHGTLRIDEADVDALVGDVDDNAKGRVAIARVNALYLATAARIEKEF